MSIVGIAASKDYLYVAMTTISKAHFEVLQHHRISVDSSNWASLVESISSFLATFHAQETIEQVAVVCCSSGMYGASPEAFKAEGFAELKCQELGYSISQVTKKSLSKHLDCQSGQTWQDVAKQRFNGQKAIKYFSSGYGAAISGAYGIAK